MRNCGKIFVRHYVRQLQCQSQCGKWHRGATKACVTRDGTKGGGEERQWAWKSKLGNWIRAREEMGEETDSHGRLPETPPSWGCLMSESDMRCTCSPF